MLSGLSRCTGLVLAPKTERPLKHIEFVPLGPGRALVVMVTEDGLVENRVIDVPLGLPPSTLVAASNFLNARLIGRTIEEAKSAVAVEVESNRAQLDELTARLIEQGLATWAGSRALAYRTSIRSGPSRLSLRRRASASVRIRSTSTRR